MSLAFAEAEAAGARGEVPIGAVLVDPARGVLAAAGIAVTGVVVTGVAGAALAAAELAAGVALAGLLAWALLAAALLALARDLGVAMTGEGGAR